jgi:hypothetical protein
LQQQEWWQYDGLVWNKYGDSDEENDADGGCRNIGFLIGDSKTEPEF